jgi:uncharacterized membrane protein
MKRVLILIYALTVSIGVFAQNDDRMMGNRNGNSSGSSSFSTTEVFLGAILIVLIIGGVIWIVNNSRKEK